MRPAIYTFVEEALPDYTVVWANQDGPSPTFPYAELRVISPPKGVGRAEVVYDTVGPNFRERLEQDADFTLEVQMHARLDTVDGRPMSEVRETLIDATALEIAAQRDGLLEALSVAGLVVRRVISITDLTALGGQRHESRTAVDIAMGLRVRSDLLVDWFSEIGVTATITDGENFTGTVGT
jgi:hypothetical protein